MEFLGFYCCLFLFSTERFGNIIKMEFLFGMFIYCVYHNGFFGTVELTLHKLLCVLILFMFAFLGVWFYSHSVTDIFLIRKEKTIFSFLKTWINNQFCFFVQQKFLFKIDLFIENQMFPIKKMIFKLMALRITALLDFFLSDKYAAERVCWILWWKNCWVREEIVEERKENEE